MKVGFFHPQFKGVGSTENLIVAQAQYLRGLGLDVSVISRIRTPARWRAPLSGVTLRDFDPLAWNLLDFRHDQATRLARSLPRAEAVLRECERAIAHGFPACALLGAAAISGERVWYCSEPQRQLHLIDANPRLHQRVTSQPGRSHAERFYAKQLAQYHLSERHDSRLQRLRAFDRTHTPRVERICANSEYTRDNVQRTYARNDVQVVHPMVEFPAQRGRTRAGVDRSRGLQVLALSRLDAVKNLEHVVSGFALYAARAPGAQLHVVGMGTQRRGLRALSRRLGVAGGVRFHGNMKPGELDRIYDACDVFALTPLDEPFGSVFPEAAARGLLLVGPDHAGPYEILDGGRLGWVCDPFSAEALAEVFREIAGLSDGEVDARRMLADGACRSRYGLQSVGHAFARAIRLPGALSRATG